MAISTLGRDYDISRILADHERRISFLERRLLLLGFIVTPGVVYDTGWVAVPANTGFTSSLSVRRIGHSVMLRGSLLPTTDWGAANSSQQPVAAGGIPEQFRSPISLNFVGATAATTVTTNFRVQVQSNGGINVRCTTASHTNSCSVNFTYLDN